ncbi:hypothetical protein SEVIR_5G097700v4 [Setaria viridis]|uniref:AB hydrolase-1 domain-containing protein n=2 Tax=Setaria TaxID=4554 RepID=K3XQY1_SETIT|nr:lecithin-cholesterol acyltransferase-like 1 [Setaria italica]XP_034598017.1 lecithin-cholesterol acyltransferase-like 1 [Setaria viridis]RCV24611.1 hypothetical protein SETIT_5G099600v2 [Setaria italica]TKW13388.1 hypothetical protein SEVIR_5G097700v2 [Setaria viridis]
MAGAPTLLLRLLPLLLLLLPSGLREYLSPAAIINRRPEDATTAPGAADEVALHPIVLVPGISCSELEARLTDAYRPSLPRCGAMKGKGWFGLWANSTDLAAHHYVPCFTEQMSLAYDPAAGDYLNLPGVETRVRNFGSSRGFQRNPKHSDWCFEVLRRALERVGYRDGDTLFGAPYDLRHAPPPPAPGQPSEVFSRYFRRLTRLIEDASRRNQGKKVILFGHSFGGTVALDFVRSTPMSWRRGHIKHLVLAAPLPAAAGFVRPLRNFASGSALLYVPGTAALPLTLRPMWRSFESAILNFPSPAVFGRRPVVVTRERNYSAHDMEEFLAAVGAGAAVEPFRRRAVPRMRYFQAPMVPTTCINGVGNETPEQLVYWDGDFDKVPEVVNGDGDEDINLISMLEFDEQMRRQPEQKKMFKSIKLHGASHGTIVTEEWTLKRVMQEILEANRM